MANGLNEESLGGAESWALLSAVRDLADSGRRSAEDLPDAQTAFVPLDEVRLAALRQALRTGETGMLPGGLAAQVEQVRAKGYEEVRFAGAGGDELDGALWTHSDSEPRPAIVMPSPWVNQGWTAYTGIAARFQEWGYHVLAYTARGFGDSSGLVETAGDNDVADAGMAVDHLLERLGGRVTKVGFLGESYGSGISQMAAAAEGSRAAAVAALSTWGDMGAAFYENGTRHLASIGALKSSPAPGRLAPDTEKMFDILLGGGEISEPLNWAASRSPLNHIDALNERGVPVYYVHAWHETIFPVNQTLELFRRLTNPKRLHLGIGDHTSPELLCLSGVAGDPILNDLHRWFDRFLKDEHNGIEDEPQIISEVMHTRARHTYADWEEFAVELQRLHLGTPQPDSRRGPLTTDRSSAWGLPLQAGPSTPARVADAVILSGLLERYVLPKRYLTNHFDQGAAQQNAGIWTTGPAGWAGLRLRGTPRLCLNLTSSADKATVLAYLFAVDPLGGGYILSHAPYTCHNGQAGTPIPAEFDLQTTDAFLPAGWRLMLVIDTADPFYDNANQPGTVITVTSEDDRPSHLGLPLA